jgi:hypothetical protein
MRPDLLGGLANHDRMSRQQQVRTSVVRPSASASASGAQALPSSARAGGLIPQI